MKAVAFPHQNLFLKDIEKKLVDKSFLKNIVSLLDNNIQIQFGKIFEGSFIDIKFSMKEGIYSDAGYLYEVSLSGLIIHWRALHVRGFDKIVGSPPYTFKNLNINNARNCINDGYLHVLNVKITEYLAHLKAQDEPSYIDKFMENLRGPIEPEVVFDGVDPFQKDIQDAEMMFTDEQINEHEKWLDSFQEKLLESGEYSNEKKLWIHTIVSKLKKRLKSLSVSDWITLLFFDYAKLIKGLRFTVETAKDLMNFIELYLKSQTLIDYIPPLQNLLT